MATVDGLTKARMLAIEGASVVSGSVDMGTGHLMLTTHDGTIIDAGYVWGTIGYADQATAGIVEFADASEVATGTNTTRVLAPADLKGAVDTLNTAINGKQASDSDLTAIAALAPANDDVIQRKAGAWTNRTMAQLMTDLGAQPSDSDLTAIAALAPANDDIIQRKSGAWTNRTIAQLKTDLGEAAQMNGFDHNGTSYVATASAGTYTGPAANDPGAVPNGSIWFQTAS